MWRIAFASLCGLAIVCAGFPQSQMSSGDINGTVTDLQSGALSGATIRLKNIETGWTKQTVSDMSGDWHFFVVPPGAYEVRAEQPGFVTITRTPIHVTIGATVDVDFRMEVAGISSEVLIQADSPILEIEKTQQSDTITTEQIDNLPINQRNYLGFTQLTSGVTDSAGLNTFSLPQAPTSNLSFLGHRLVAQQIGRMKSRHQWRATIGLPVAA